MTIAGKTVPPVKSVLEHLLGLLLGSLVYSAGLNLFLVPNEIIDGGVVGVGLIMTALTGVPFSVWIVALNIPFFFLGYRKVGASLAAYASAAVLILSFWSPIFEAMEPVTRDPFLATIFGGMIIGIGVGTNVGEPREPSVSRDSTPGGPLGMRRVQVRSLERRSRPAQSRPHFFHVEPRTLRRGMTLVFQCKLPLCSVGDSAHAHP